MAFGAISLSILWCSHLNLGSLSVKARKGSILFWVSFSDLQPHSRLYSVLLACCCSCHYFVCVCFFFFLSFLPIKKLGKMSKFLQYNFGTV